MAKAPSLMKIEAIGPRLLNLDDAAKYLGIAKKTLQNGLAVGKFPFKAKYIGTKPLLDVRDLEQYADSL